MPKLNHTTVVAYLALFVALGGSAYAATKITGAQIANGTITGVDLKDSSVRSADVKGITGADLGPGAPWTLRSPNKNFSLAVSDAGVVMRGPNHSVTVDNTGVIIDGGAHTEIRTFGALDLKGSVIKLNGGCRPVADATKIQGVNHAHATPGGNTTGPVPAPAPGLPAFTTVFAC